MAGVTGITYLSNESTGLEVQVSATNPLPVTGAITVAPGPATGANTGTTTSVASAASTTSLLAADANRYGFTVANTDANLLYVLLGTGTASATNYTFTVAPNSDRTVSDYTGAVQGIWAADGSGAALLTVIS